MSNMDAYPGGLVGPPLTDELAAQLEANLEKKPEKVDDRPRCPECGDLLNGVHVPPCSRVETPRVLENRWNINVRGTHGSGKTTISRRFIDEHTVVKEHFGPVTANCDKKRYTKPICYEIEGGLFCLGRYQSGLDGIMPYTVVGELVSHYAPLGHVIWENVLVSGNASSWTGLAEGLVPQSHTVWAFLDTPLQTCIDRIYKRREARAAEGWKHRQTEIKLGPIEQGWKRIRRIALKTPEWPYIDGRWIDHNRGYEQVHNMLVSEAGWKCKTHGEGVLL